MQVKRLDKRKTDMRNGVVKEKNTGGSGLIRVIDDKENNKRYVHN